MAQRLQTDYGTGNGTDTPTTVAQFAALNGLTSLLEGLIARGVDLSARSEGRKRLLYFATLYYSASKQDSSAYANSLRTFRALFRAGVDPNALEDTSPFLSLRYLLTKNPRLDAFQLFLEYRADVKAVNPRTSISVLHSCCHFCDDAQVLRAILEGGADVAHKDYRGETALHGLMCRRTVPFEYVEQLLAAGADVNEEDLRSQRKLEHY